MSRFRKGQRVTEQEMNALRDTAISNRLIAAGAGVEVQHTPAGASVSLASKRKWPVMAMITDAGPNGEDDYSEDERYWVRAMACTTSTGDSEERITVEEADALDINGNIVEDTGGVVFGFWVTATNMAEVVAESHTLAVGTPVQVYPLYDSRQYANAHWVFWGAGAGGSNVNPYAMAPTPEGDTDVGIETADTETWDRTAPQENPDNEGADPTDYTDGVELMVHTRTAYDDTSDEILYGFYRTLTFDSTGALALISAETRYIIDTPGECP